MNGESGLQYDRHVSVLLFNLDSSFARGDDVAKPEPTVKSPQDFFLSFTM